ncbi:MAG: WYL domain-containing protein [Prevotella sp.]|nr:WYL domain-containing protein [Prevotella sp.]
MPKTKNFVIRAKVLDSLLRCPFGTSRKEMKRIVNIELDRQGATPVSSLETISSDMRTIMNLFFVSIIPVRHEPDSRTVYYRYRDTDFSIFKQPLQVADVVRLAHLGRNLKRYGHVMNLPWLDELVAKLDIHMNPKGQNIVEFEESYDVRGLSFFNSLYKAIVGRRVIRIVHRRFGDEARTHVLIPRYLRQFDRRWYLLASYPNKPKEVYFFALDRMESCTMDASVPYIDSEIDVQQYFHDIYGISKPRGAEPIDILYFVEKDEIGYVTTNPLHHSQKIVQAKEEGVVMSIHVIQNTEILLRFLSYGEKVIILTDCHLRNQIMAKIEIEMLKYKSTT